MDENLKTRVMLGLGIVSVILLITNVNSCNSLRGQERKWRTEMAQRLDSEEKAQKAGQEAATLADQLKKSQSSGQENAKDLESAKKALMQEQLVNQNLKLELEKVSKLKEALEADLKNALVRCGSNSKQPKK